MILSLEGMGPESKVYIFPSSRKFYRDELPVLNKKILNFCEEFKGVDIFFEIRYGRFLVFVVSEGTSLDLDQHNELIAFIQGLEEGFKLVLLDKVNVSFKQGEYIQMKEIPEFKKLIKNRGVSPKTVVFDHMINTKYEYENVWELPAGQSWLSHFFN
ncbi:ABC transporter ATPase [Lutimonas saemankumensis]|uniref:ABC transporter ATPase n=1 Tax=Lutimonas saemankumensis TaxID=483016 RepID=UPI001CD781A6|nr:ABC transporter ATPase [Lutimonas saemankumensis]MCA0930814.1 ABC transporter ATPase [Lutimonas saemankumensis]